MGEDKAPTPPTLEDFSLENGGSPVKWWIMIYKRLAVDRTFLEE